MNTDLNDHQRLPQRLFIGELVWVVPACELQPRYLTTLYRTFHEAVANLKEDFARELPNAVNQGLKQLKFRKETQYPRLDDEENGEEEGGEEIREDEEVPNVLTVDPDSVENVGQDLLDAVWSYVEYHDELCWRPGQFASCEETNKCTFRAAVYELSFDSETQTYRRGSSDSPLYRLPRQARSVNSSDQWKYFLEKYPTHNEKNVSTLESRKKAKVSPANDASTEHYKAPIASETYRWPDDFYLAGALFILPNWESQVEFIYTISADEERAKEECHKLVLQAFTDCYPSPVDFEDHDLEHFSSLFGRPDVWTRQALISLWHTRTAYTDDRQDGVGIRAEVRLLRWNPSLLTYQSQSWNRTKILPATSKADCLPKPIETLVRSWYLRPSIPKTLLALSSSAHYNNTDKTKCPQMVENTPLFLVEATWLDLAQRQVTVQKHSSVHVTFEAACDDAKTQFYRLLHEVGRVSDRGLEISKEDVMAIGFDLINALWCQLQQELDDHQIRFGEDSLHVFVYQLSRETEAKQRKYGVWRPIDEETMLIRRYSTGFDKPYATLFHLPCTRASREEKWSTYITSVDSPDKIRVGREDDKQEFRAYRAINEKPMALKQPLTKRVFLVETLTIRPLYHTYVFTTTAILNTFEDAVGECRTRFLSELEGCFRGGPSWISNAPIKDDATLNAMGSDYIDALWWRGNRADGRLGHRARVFEMLWDNKEQCYKKRPTPCYKIPLRYNTEGYPAMEQFIKEWYGYDG